VIGVIGWWLQAVTWAAPSPVAVVVSDELEAYRLPTEAFLAEFGGAPRVYNLHGRASEAAAVVAQLQLAPPQVVLCVGAKAAYAVKNGLPQAVVVYAAVLEPRRYGLEGEAVTGVTMTIDPVTYLSQFVGFFPEVQTVGVIRGPETPDARVLAMSAAAVEVDRELLIARADSPREVRRAVHELAVQGVDAVWVPPDRSMLTTSGYRAVAEEARRRHLPLLVDTASMVEAGGLFTMTPDPEGVGRQAAAIVEAVLAGEAVPRPQDPEDLQVVLNLRTIEAAELPFDRAMLDFVDEVVQ
jgi:putative tryptophan/tyrosine transport system substrate-binding protein